MPPWRVSCTWPGRRPWTAAAWLQAFLGQPLPPVDTAVLSACELEDSHPSTGLGDSGAQEQPALSLGPRAGEGTGPLPSLTCSKEFLGDRLVLHASCSSDHPNCALLPETSTVARPEDTARESPETLTVGTRQHPAEKLGERMSTSQPVF